MSPTYKQHQQWMCLIDRPNKTNQTISFAKTSGNNNIHFLICIKPIPHAVQNKGRNKVVNRLQKLMATKITTILDDSNYTEGAVISNEESNDDITVRVLQYTR